MSLSRPSSQKEKIMRIFLLLFCCCLYDNVIPIGEKGDGFIGGTFEAGGCAVWVLLGDKEIKRGIMAQASQVLVFNGYLIYSTNKNYNIQTLFNDFSKKLEK